MQRRCLGISACFAVLLSSHRRAAALGSEATACFVAETGRDGHISVPNPISAVDGVGRLVPIPVGLEIYRFSERHLWIGVVARVRLLSDNEFWPLDWFNVEK